MGFLSIGDTKRNNYFLMFTEGENADISANVYDNISVVAGILKLYLRLLPLPLITYEAHPAIIRAIRK